jgi:hypothetical protein
MNTCDAECKVIWDDPAYRAMIDEVDRINHSIMVIYLDMHGSEAIHHLRQQVKELRAPFENKIASIEDRYYMKDAEECLKSIQRIERNCYHPYPAYYIKKPDELPSAVSNVIIRLMKIRYNVDNSGTIPRDDHNILVFEINE